MAKLLISIIVLILAVLLLQIDDDLDPVAAQLISKAEPAGKHDSYAYLWGIDASANEDPYEVGKSLITSIKRSEAAGGITLDSVTYEPYPEAKKLPLPKDSLICTVRNDGCIEMMFKGGVNIDRLVQDNTTLISRYNYFNSLNQYNTQTQAHLSEPLPSYEYITTGNSLVLLKAIRAAAMNSCVISTALLKTNISGIRNQLKQQDTLIGKLVYLNLLSENLDVAFLVLGICGNSHYFEVPALAEHERTLELAMSREYSAFYSVIKEIARNPEAFKKGGSLPGWMVRTVIKPNITANDKLPLYVNAIKLSTLSPKMFLEKVSVKGVAEFETSYVRNLVGSIFNQVAAVNYDETIAVFFDIDAKIFLYNSMARSLDVKFLVGGISNPYYDTGHYASITADGNWACFDGPLPDTKRQRCLRIKI